MTILADVKCMGERMVLICPGRSDAVDALKPLQDRVAEELSKRKEAV